MVADLHMAAEQDAVGNHHAVAQLTVVTDMGRRHEKRNNFV